MSLAWQGGTIELPEHQAALKFEKPMGIQASADQFHEDNPHVYELIVKLARQVKARGYKVYSMDAIFHRVRWHFNIETVRDPEEEFKLNNNYTSRYARMVMTNEPDLVGFFKLRGLKAR